MGNSRHKTPPPSEGPCCLDEESGLYHLGHFKSVLAQELARLDRWERPLSLAIVEVAALGEGGWRRLGCLLKDCLRRIDLAARLTPHRAAVIMPDADEHRARRWLAELLAEMEREGLSLDSSGARWGLAMARPWEGLTEEELIENAARRLGRETFESAAHSGDAPDGAATALKADERDLLFAGFQALEARRHH